jgi:hypothetical protein
MTLLSTLPFFSLKIFIRVSIFYMRNIDPFFSTRVIRGLDQTKYHKDRSYSCSAFEHGVDTHDQIDTTFVGGDVRAKRTGRINYRPGMALLSMNEDDIVHIEETRTLSPHLYATECVTK